MKLSFTVLMKVQFKKGFAVHLFSSYRVNPILKDMNFNFDALYTIL